LWGGMETPSTWPAGPTAAAALPASSPTAAAATPLSLELFEEEEGRVLTFDPFDGSAPVRRAPRPVAFADDLEELFTDDLEVLAPSGRGVSDLYVKGPQTSFAMDGSSGVACLPQTFDLFEDAACEQYPCVSGQHISIVTGAPETDSPQESDFGGPECAQQTFDSFGEPEVARGEAFGDVSPPGSFHFDARSLTGRRPGGDAGAEVGGSSGSGAAVSREGRGLGRALRADDVECRQRGILFGGSRSGPTGFAEAPTSLDRCHWQHSRGEEEDVEDERGLMNHGSQLLRVESGGRLRAAIPGYEELEHLSAYAGGAGASAAPLHDRHLEALHGHDSSVLAPTLRLASMNLHESGTPKVGPGPPGRWFPAGHVFDQRNCESSPASPTGWTERHQRRKKEKKHTPLQQRVDHQTSGLELARLRSPASTPMFANQAGKGSSAPTQLQSSTHGMRPSTGSHVAVTADAAADRCSPQLQTFAQTQPRRKSAPAATDGLGSAWAAAAAPAAGAAAAAASGPAVVTHGAAMAGGGAAGMAPKAPVVVTSERSRPACAAAMAAPPPPPQTLAPPPPQTWAQLPSQTQECPPARPQPGMPAQATLLGHPPAAAAAGAACRDGGRRQRSASRGAAERRRASAERRRTTIERSTDWAERDGVRTLMVRNIPVRYTQDMLLKEWPNSCTYDFLYLPICIDRKRNVSFAFVNFVTPEAATQFHGAWHKQRLAHFSARKPLDISPADVQGRDENLLQIIRNKTFRIRNAYFQPAIFDGGDRISMEEFVEQRHLCKLATSHQNAPQPRGSPAQ